MGLTGTQLVGSPTKPLVPVDEAEVRNLGFDLNTSDDVDSFVAGPSSKQNAPRRTRIVMLPADIPDDSMRSSSALYADNDDNDNVTEELRT